MFKEVKCFRVYCDTCNKPLEDDPDYALLESKDDFDAGCYDWIVLEDKHYCSDCGAPICVCGHDFIKHNYDFINYNYGDCSYDDVCTCGKYVPIIA